MNIEHSVLQATLLLLLLFSSTNGLKFDGNSWKIVTTNRTGNETEMQIASSTSYLAPILLPPTHLKDISHENRNGDPELLYDRLMNDNLAQLFGGQMAQMDPKQQQQKLSDQPESYPQYQNYLKQGEIEPGFSKDQNLGPAEVDSMGQITENQKIQSQNIQPEQQPEMLNKESPVHMYQEPNGSPLPLAVYSTERRIYTIPIKSHRANQQPAIIEVPIKVTPIVMRFSSRSSPILMENHYKSQEGVKEEAQSVEQPHRMVHEVIKPVWHEILEQIKPKRKIVQMIYPVEEEVKTVVHKDSAGEHAQEHHGGNNGHNHGQNHGLGEKHQNDHSKVQTDHQNQNQNQQPSQNVNKHPENKRTYIPVH